MPEPRVGTIVDGTFEINPDLHSQFFDLVGPHLLETRERAAGCIYYTLAKDVLQNEVLHLIEGWSNRKALDAHLASERLQVVRAQFGRFSIRNYRCTIYTVSDQVAYFP